jgi:BirA family biotin operon repressor/biotin-[acetyl-CoA-carboxylase] ligase
MGSPILFLPSTASTNDVAARLADAGAADGTTVVADTQTAGRGRLGRSWFSPPGAGLYVSVVVRPAVASPEPWGRWPRHPGEMGGLPISSQLTLVAGVALAEAVRTATKWPNDLVFGGRKLAGILAEASAQGGAIDYVILGIGINVRAVTYPPEIALRASSVEAELGRPVDRGALFAALLANLGRGIDASAHDDIAAWLDRWRALSPSAVGAVVEWRGPDGLRRGRTAGLDDDGALLVNARGAVERVVAGEVTWL